MRPFLFGFVIRGCNQKFSDFGFIPDLGKTNFRTFEVPRGSTKQHDIYSFGIIVQEGISGQYHRTVPFGVQICRFLIKETFYRHGPFFMGYDEPMKASEKVTALLNDDLELFMDDFMQTGMT